MSFKDILIERLSARDNTYNKYHEIIASNNRLLQQTIELEKKTKLLEISSQKNVSSEGTTHTSQQVLELDRRIRELHEERAEMYKSQSENAQRLVNMNEQLRYREEKDKKQTDELKRLSESVKKLSARCNLQIQQLREKDVTIQILQDELAALQLEMITTEERNKKLTIENEQLLTRWMAKMNEEAEKMNEATQFYESALEKARAEAEKQNQLQQSKRKDISLMNLPSTIVLPKKASKRINVHDAEIHCIAASSTGTMVATGGADKKVKLIDGKTGNLIQTLSGALQTITSVSFNPTDQMILGSCTDNATRIWSLSTYRLRHTLTGHIGKVYSAKFTMDSNKVVSGSHDRTLKIWDLQKGYNIRTIFTFSSCNDVCLMDPDGQTLISGHLDNNVRIWDARSGVGIKELTGIHSGQITSVSMSPDGTTLLTNSRDNTLKIIDIRMYDIVKSYQADSYRNGLNWSRSCFSPDGRYITAGSLDGALHIWDTQTGKLERAISEHGSVICGVSWSANGEYIYSAEKNKMVCMWDSSLQAK